MSGESNRDGAPPPTTPAGDDLVWIAAPRGVLDGAAAGGPRSPPPRPEPVRPGRYAGFDGDAARIDMRIDAEALSGDLFRTGPAGETWVAAFRTRTDMAPALGAELPLIAQDRLGRTSEGVVSVAPDGAELSLRVTLSRKLDGLPVNEPIRALMRFAGEAFRRMEFEMLGEAGVPPPPTVSLAGRSVGIEEALEAAGIQVVAARMRDDLHAAPAGGWSEKQLHTLMSDFARSDLSRPGFGVRLLWLSRSNRSDLEGVMFDRHDDLPRQGAAVFAGKIRADAGADIRDRKLVQTAVHEIGHTLNLAHRFSREVARRDSLSFMNYDWKHRDGAGAFWRDFAFRFDADELSFLRHGPFRAVSPGGDPFGSARYWMEGRGGYSPIHPEREWSDWKLELIPPVSGPIFRFAQPVLLGVRFTNGTDRALTFPKSFLDQKAGFLEIAVQRETGDRPGDAAIFHPITHRCASAATAGAVRTIQPGETVDDNINLTFGADGFAFAEPGNYRVIAYLVLELNGTDHYARSAPLRIRVASPQSDMEEAAALDLLDPAAGACIALGGSAALDSAASRLMDLADRLSRGGKSRPHPIATNIYRALAFHYGRGYVRYRDGELADSAPQPENARLCRKRLSGRALDIFDPVTRAETDRFLKKAAEKDE